MNRLNKFKLFNSSLMFNKSLCISMSLSSPSETCPLVSELKSRIFIEDNNQTESNIAYIFPNKIQADKEYIPLSLWDLVEYVYTHNLDVSDFVHKIITSSNISANATSISVNTQFTNVNEISASALENYFQCPLKYFFNYVLKLKEPMSSDIEMLDIGNILHAVAQKYYLTKNREQLDIMPFCSNTIKHIVEKDERLQQHIDSPILSNLIAESIRFIQYLRELDDNSKFIPSFFEKPFGANYNLPGLPITDKVSLKGKIDRIDFCNNHFRIIDYKSGNADATLAELYYGKKLQLFLYALAIKNATKKELSGMFYLPIKNVIEKSTNNDNIYKLIGFYTDDIDLVEAYDISIKTNLKSKFVNMALKKDGSLYKRGDKILTTGEMDRLLEYARQISAVALSQIEQGKFKASPLKFDNMHNACTYCPYLVLCSKSSNKIPFRSVCKVNKDSFVGGENE